jgi:hypothetical protein
MSSSFHFDSCYFIIATITSNKYIDSVLLIFHEAYLVYNEHDDHGNEIGIVHPLQFLICLLSKGYAMGLFSKILDKLGLNKDKQADEAQAQALANMAKKEAEARAKLAAAKPAAPVAATAAKPAPVTPKTTTDDGVEKITSAPPVVTPAVKPISEVDVVKQLEQMAQGSGLDWKVSIVDLLKVLKIDSSLDARKELAQELGCPLELMGGDHSKMNIWLHKTVLKKIAENGGNIPANLLD